MRRIVGKALIEHHAKQPQQQQLAEVAFYGAPMPPYAAQAERCQHQQRQQPAIK